MQISIRTNGLIGENQKGLAGRNNQRGGTASLRSRPCVERNAVFGARLRVFLCIFQSIKREPDTYHNGLGYIYLIRYLDSVLTL